MVVHAAMPQMATVKAGARVLPRDNIAQGSTNIVAIEAKVRVFTAGDQIYRAMSAEAFTNWQQVSNQAFFQKRSLNGQVVGTEEISAAAREKFSLPSHVAAVLKHERMPFISYPYEWSFGMLRQAALLHLEILIDAVSSGQILKDASPYNVQFRGSQPVFIDIGSFTPLVPGEPWLAYRQFCEMMLFPLLLQAYRGVDFQTILRSQLEGIPPRQFIQWIRWTDLFRPGVFTNGWLQAKLEQKTQGTQTSTVRDLQSSGFNSLFIVRMLKSLKRILERLKWVPRQTQWTSYNDTLPHVAQDGQIKSEFVRHVCQASHRRLVWDLGCNDGRYSKIASEHATTVVAMDQDHACVERLFNASLESRSNILPLCIDLANTSPAQGWQGHERKRLEDRGRPNLVICLGIIHHLVLAANIPLPHVVDWLASLGGELILEFPSKQDVMVRALLRNKSDQYEDYSIEHLESELQKYFRIQQRQSLPSGARTLFHAIPCQSV